ncbi:MAG TPA: acid phosphatase [Burkholderiales bacterium]|nr:acid phosphatase [Burkholderiales bacterium]
MDNRFKYRIALALFVALLAGSCATRVEDGLSRIEHIVVVYAENRSFDHLYGLFPGAEGIAQATAEQKTQVDHDGKPLATLPASYDPVQKGRMREDLPTAGLPNGPFRIDAPPINKRWNELLPNPIHAYFHHREQINGGRNNRFIAASNVGAWTMGYFDGSQMKLWNWAKEYTLADHFFMGAYGGSYLNHLWLVCACTPRDEAGARAQLDDQGYLSRRPTSPASVMQGVAQLFDGAQTPDGYSVNTTQPPYQPSGIPPAAGGNLEVADPSRHTLPPMREKSVGDTLSAKGVSWAWYAGGWNAAEADGRRDPKAPREVIYSFKGQAFQPHHQPFNYFARFAPGTADRARHLKDGDDFMKDIAAGTLPQVTFYKPVGRLNQHPGYTNIADGDEHLHQVLTRLRASPQWKSMLVIVTYDENGGFWDHVPPPTGDRWGPGSRIPAIIISPYARRGYVDKTSYDTTSIIKLITRRFGLEPLPGVRPNAGDLTNALAF